MPVSKEIKDAVKRDLLKDEPLMDLPAVRETFMEWLRQWKRPDRRDGDWADLVQEFPAAPADQSADKGTRMRLAVRLNTKTNRYLVAVLESLNPESRGVYFVSVYVNWREDEYRLQKAVESSYAGSFDDSLKPKHTLWAQTFRAQEFADALNCCATAMLGNELIAPEPLELSGQPLKREIVTPPLAFPKPHDD